MKTDRLWLKAYTTLVWAMDTVQQVFVIITTYRYFVTDFGNFDALLHPKR